jgi:anaerobic magnesium-protoporphyrin IX monomethyl ester cyclase
LNLAGHPRILALVPPAPRGKVIRDLAYGCWCGGDRVGGGNVPPAHLLLVCTWLRHLGYDVRLFDGNETRASTRAIQRLAGEADIVLCLTSSLTFGSDLAVLKAFKSARRELLTIVYGSHPTFCTESVLASGAVDLALLGYPEAALAQLLPAIEAGTTLAGIPALAYKDGTAVRVNRRPAPSIFADLPVIEYGCLDSRLRYRNPLVRHYPYVTALTSRGCASSCAFCTAPAFAGHRVEAWPAEKVVEQLERIAAAGYREVFFRDETFSLFRERNQRICEALLRRGIRLSWICNVKPGTATRTDLQLMREAGCRLVKLGIESGSDEVLGRSGKGITAETTRGLLADVHAVGLASHAHLMLGMPGDTVESIQATLNLVLELEPATLDVGICTPLPGTELWAQLGDRSGVAEREVEAARLHTEPIFSPQYCSVPPAELKRWVREFYRRFYLRPGYVLRRAREPRSVRAWVDLVQAGLEVVRFMR